MSKSARGFTLVETLVGTSVLIIFFGAIAAIIQVALRSVGESRVRTAAATLAQQRIELARNLPFNDVGTVGGIPSGSLQQVESVDQNGQTFEITTSIVFIDDEYDGEAPDDPIPTDYKRVRVSVDWGGVFAPESPVELWTDIAPRGLETAANTGTLSVLVFDAQGQPLSSANVHIESDGVSPSVNLDTQTDATGRVLLPGAPNCIQCYEVTVTRGGYSTDQTHGTDDVTNPNKPHMSVFEGQVSQTSFAIDQVSSMTLRAVRGPSNNYSPFQGVQLHIVGTKEIGRTATDDPVYKVDQLITTGAGGSIDVPNLEWDSYTISIPTGASIDFAASWPFSPVILQPGQHRIFTTMVEPASANTLRVIVKDEIDTPIASASVELAKDPFIATASTGIQGNPDYSQVFFDSLTGGSYNLRVFSEGYQEATASISISGEVAETFILNLSE